MSIIFKKAGLNKIIFNNCPDSTANLTIDNMLLFLIGTRNYQNETHAVYWDSARWVYVEMGVREISSTFSNADYPWLVEGFGIKTCVNNKKIKFLKSSLTPPVETIPNQIVISNAGTSIFNDTYTKQNGTINGYSYWVGNTNGYYLSVIQTGPPGNFMWAVTDDTIPPIGINNGYVFYLMGPIFNPIILNYPPETTSVNAVNSAQGSAILTYLNN